MKRLLVIPARSGSKRLPQKNFKLLNNKPLVFYTIDAALKSNVFDKIIFTCDDQIALGKVEESYTDPRLQVHLRNKNLASDTSKVIDTVVSLIDNDFDQTWLSLPTSPLKIEEDFIHAAAILDEAIDGVISYTEMDFPPTLGINVDENSFLSDYDKTNPWINGNSRSQDHPIVHRPNGAIYGAWTQKLAKFKNFYSVGKVKGYYMSKSRSIDIDTQFEFDLAEFMLSRKKD